MDDQSTRTQEKGGLAAGAPEPNPASTLPSEVKCWSCKASLPVTADNRGKTVKCPRCGTKQRLPAPPAPAEEHPNLVAIPHLKEAWQAALRNGQVVVCSVENRNRAMSRGFLIDPETIILSQGHFSKAEIGVLGHDIVLRTLIGSMYDQDVRIPLQEVEWASSRTIGRTEHIKKRVLHFVGLGAGTGIFLGVYFFLQMLQGKPVPLRLSLLLWLGLLVGGAALGLLFGLATSAANEVTLSTTSGTLVTIYVKKRQLRRLRALLGNVGIHWKQLETDLSQRT